MTDNPVLLIILAVINTAFSGGFGAWLGHRHKSQVQYDSLTLQISDKISKEQEVWRQYLQERVDEAYNKISRLEKENVELRGQIATLTVINEDLKADNKRLEDRVKELKGENKRLETRVRELERDLKTYQEKSREQ